MAGVITLNTPRTSQPQGAVEVDRNSPLIAGDTRVLVGSNYQYDPSTRQLYTVSSGIAPNVSKCGLAPRGKSSAQLALLSRVDTAVPYTVATVSRGMFKLATKQHGFTGATGVVWSSGFKAQAQVWDTSVSSFKTVSTTVSDTAWLSIVVTMSAAKVMSLYVDGALIGTQTIDSFSSDSNPALGIQFQDGTVYGETPIAVRTGNCWSASEVAAWSSNPWQIFKPIPRRIWVPSGVGDVIAALTGAQSTSSAGQAAPSNSAALTGAQLAVDAGTLTAVIGGDVSAALAGSASASAAGTVTVSQDRALTGVQLTADSGAIIPAVSNALTGVAVSSGAGTLTAVTGADVVVALSGQGVAVAAGTVGFTKSGSLALSGATATADAGTTAAQADLALSGSQVAISAGTLTAVVESGVTVALSGSQSAASSGQVAPSADVALAGSSAAASAGNVSAGADVTVALTGASVTSTSGVFLAGLQRAVTGSQLTTSTGTLLGAADLGLQGIAVSSGVGVLTPVGGVSTQILNIIAKSAAFSQTKLASGKFSQSLGKTAEF